MASENETIADIVAVMRHDAELCYDIWLNDPNNNSQSDSICKILNSYADRLEAAAKRERLLSKPPENDNSAPVVSTGDNSVNAAAMREALSDACYAMFNFLKTQNGGYEEMANALDKAKAALAAPARNCDKKYLDNVDMYQQFKDWCNAKGHTMNPKLASDAFDWLLAAAEEGAEDEQK